jgi:hypothetical protein
VRLLPFVNFAQMARSIIVGFVVAIFAIFTGSASAQHRVLLLHPGETRTFDAVNRGDTVLCRGLHLTVQRTPSYTHVRGAAFRRLGYRYVYGNGLVLSFAAPQPHRVTATCKRR